MSDFKALSHPRGSAFLLAQLGEHAATRFADRVAELDLSPPLAGVIRLVGQQPAISQRALADLLGAAPSRVVALIDELEQRGVLTRTRSPEDRRVQQLRLTSKGERILGELAAVAQEHDTEITAALSEPEREELRRLLARLAEGNGLAPGVHPGYRAH